MLPVRVADKICLNAGLGRTQTPVLETPALQALQRHDQAAWDEAFDWLMPTALAVAHNVLASTLPGDVEDVAIEALEGIVEKVVDLDSADELKPLTACIAHHRAVSLLRERFAQKRGSGRTLSLTQAQEENDDSSDPSSPDSAFEHLAQSELAGLLTKLRENVKPDYREALKDFFLEGLSYEEIASKRGWAIGTVGVYLKRGMDAMRQNAEQHPTMLKDLNAFLRLFL